MSRVNEVELNITDVDNVIKIANNPAVILSGDRLSGRIGGRHLRVSQSRHGGGSLHREKDNTNKNIAGERGARGKGKGRGSDILSRKEKRKKKQNGPEMQGW